MDDIARVCKLWQQAPAPAREGEPGVNPMKPGSSSSLFVTGIYAVTRKPMYLGLLLVLLAWAIYLTNVLTVLFLRHSFGIWAGIRSNRKNER